MSKKSDLYELGYNEMMRDLWCNAWECTGFTGKWRPRADHFYRYMQALRNHINVLEKRIEEFEKLNESKNC